MLFLFHKCNLCNNYFMLTTVHVLFVNPWGASISSNTKPLMLPPYNAWKIASPCCKIILIEVFNLQRKFILKKIVIFQFHKVLELLNCFQYCCRRYVTQMRHLLRLFCFMHSRGWPRHFWTMTLFTNMEKVLVFGQFYSSSWTFIRANWRMCI